MKEFITFCLNWLKSAPRWIRAVVPLLVAALAVLYLCTSCGVVQRVQLEKRMTRETKDTTRLIISQTTSRTRAKVRTYRATFAPIQHDGAISEFIPFTSVASMIASPDGENSDHLSQSAEVSSDLAKRSDEIDRTTDVLTPEGDFKPLRCGVNEIDASKPIWR